MSVEKKEKVMKLTGRDLLVGVGGSFGGLFVGLGNVGGSGAMCCSGCSGGPKFFEEFLSLGP